MKFTYDEVVNGIIYGQEGSINLNFEDAMTFTKILLNRGYAVLYTGGDIGDDVRIDWKYAGDTKNLNWANRKNVVFGDPDFVDMLATGDYEQEEEE